MMSRLIVLVHPRYTGSGFTSTSPALKRRDRRYRAGCAPSAIEKGEVGMKGVCSLRLPQHSLVDGLVGFECRQVATSRWTPREGPNSCPIDVVVGNVVDFFFFLLLISLFLLLLFFQSMLLFMLSSFVYSRIVM